MWEICRHVIILRGERSHVPECELYFGLCEPNLGMFGPEGWWFYHNAAAKVRLFSCIFFRQSYRVHQCRSPSTFCYVLSDKNLFIQTETGSVSYVWNSRVRK